MTLGEFLNTQAVKAGISPDDTTLNDLLTNPEISKVNLPDAIVNKISSSLMSFEQAKTNIELKKHFRAKALALVDTNISELLDEYEVPEELRSAFKPQIVDDVKQHPNTYDNVKLIVKTIKDLEAKKQSATGTDKQKLVEQINGLNQQILDIKNNEKAEREKVIATYEDRIADMALTNHLKSYQYGTGLPDEVNIITAKTILSKALADKKANKVLDGENFKLVSAEEKDMPFTENNATVNFNDFTKRLLDENKMLKVSGSNGDQNNSTQYHQANTSQESKVVNPVAKAQAEKRLAEMQAAQ